MPRPRLNLDIFGSDEPALPANEEKVVKTPVPLNKQEDAPRQSVRSSPSPKAAENTPEPPRFVPVGFHHRHLTLLDEAVMKLRRTGYYQASKSAIIRKLIELHADELDRIWLKNRDGGAD